jgi:hypothetical protein
VQSQPLAELLQQCSGPDAGADLQLNVVAALGQLARDQREAAEALMAPQGDTSCAWGRGCMAAVIQSLSVSAGSKPFV